MDFPRYVFTSKGKEECTLGSYGVALVEDADEFKAALKSGYKEEITELFDKPETKKFIKEPKEDLTFYIEEIEGYTKAQIMFFLDEEEKEYDKKAVKSTLVGLLREAMEPEPEPEDDDDF